MFVTFLTYNIFFMSSRTISVGIREKKRTMEMINDLGSAHGQR